MQGDEQVLEFLNEQLSAELTAINQYFLHAKMQENSGWVRLAAHTRAESIDEMRHAELLAERILFLDGLPNFQRLFSLRIGQTVTQMLEADLAVEVEAVTRLRRGIEYMRSVSDVTSIQASLKAGDSVAFHVVRQGGSGNGFGNRGGGGGNWQDLYLADRLPAAKANQQ